MARRVTGSAAWALLPALALALAPAFRGSVGSLANLQWLLLVAAFWCVIERSGNRWLPSGAALLASLTTPLTVLLLPAAWLAHRSGVVRARAVQGLVLGLAVQAVLIVVGGQSAANPAVRSPGISGSLFSAVLTTVTGPNLPAVELGRLGTLDVSLPLGAILADLLAVVLYEVRGRSTLAPAAVLTAALVYFATSLLSGAPTTRYAAAAAMLLVSALALAGPRLPRALGAAAVGVLGITVVLGFPASDNRLSGPSWETGVARYEESCRTAGEATAIGLSPQGWGEYAPYCPSGN